MTEQSTASDSQDSVVVPANPDANPRKKKKRKSALRVIRNRIITGMFVALPVLITFLVILYLCNLLSKYVIGPIARLLIQFWRTQTVEELPWYVEYLVAPLVAGIIVLALLFVAGMLFRSRIHRFLNWFLLTVPGVNTIYSAVSNVFDSIQRSTGEGIEFQRVVLIEFPHPGAKVPAFVTNECTEAATGKRILCIYVPTTPIPTSGYMLMIPEEDVVPLDWDIQMTLQAIVSGGISVPETVNYYREDKLPKKIDVETS